MPLQADETPHIVTTVRIPVDTHRRLHEIARADHRTFSGELRRLIDLRIAEADADAASAAQDVAA